MGQLAGDPVVGQLALPLQGFAVRNQSRFDDFEWLHAVPVPCPCSPVPLPRIAQRVPKMPNAMLIATHTIIPAMPKKRSRGAARKRSEERRVGKECGSRWAADDDKRTRTTE